MHAEHLQVVWQLRSSRIALPSLNMVRCTRHGRSDTDKPVAQTTTSSSSLRLGRGKKKEFCVIAGRGAVQPVLCPESSGSG